VGASRSGRKNGPLKAAATDFPDPPIATDSVSADPKSIAGFSSRAYVMGRSAT
jgi:hypothetical protein